MINGQTISDASEAYGSIYSPKTNGSAGGGTGAGGGGSTIHILAKNLILDGILNANGNDSTTGGGGSGGSILVEVDQVLSGLGTFTAQGGKATCDCGGGSGGRIGVYTRESKFIGTYEAQGGVSSSTYGTGGPGSIYIETGREVDRNLDKVFMIDNANGQQHNYLTLNEAENDIVFSNLHIKTYAKFRIHSDGKKRTLNVKKVHGDGTGLISMGNNQTGTLERIESGNNTISKLRVNLELQPGGEFIMSETVVILGLFPIALDLNGLLRGCMNLQVSEGRTVRFGKEARIIPYQETALSKQADVTFGYLQLDPGSFFNFDKDVGSTALIGSLRVKYSSQMKADYFKLRAGSIDIEQEAQFSCAGPHRRESELIDLMTGAGPGVLANGSYGGAGHGGVGGER